jgi:hypothetical protein
MNIFPDPKSFIGASGTVPPPESEWSHRSGTSIQVLDFLKGKPWDEIALAYCMALRPTKIRVSKNGVHMDSQSGRITVWLAKGDKISSIDMEVSVPLPPGIRHGAALDDAANYGYHSKEVKWHEDAESYLHDGINGKYYKEADGKMVEFPKP